MNKRLEQLKQEYNETLNRMQDLGDILAHCAEMDTSHCGLDAANNEEELQSLEELLGMEVVAICGSKTKCEGCQRGNTYCVKLELVGGDYICLAKPQQDERPVISFDEEEQQQEETTRTIMDGIREQTQAFMDYLDSVVKG